MAIPLGFLQERALLEWTCAGPLDVGSEGELVAPMCSAVLGDGVELTGAVLDAATGGVSLLLAAAVLDATLLRRGVLLAGGLIVAALPGVDLAVLLGADSGVSL